MYYYYFLLLITSFPSFNFGGGRGKVIGKLYIDLKHRIWRIHLPKRKILFLRHYMAFVVTHHILYAWTGHLRNNNGRKQRHLFCYVFICKVRCTPTPFHCNEIHVHCDYRPIKWKLNGILHSSFWICCNSIRFINNKCRWSQWAFRHTAPTDWD